MSKGNCDIFALVVNFLNAYRQPKQMTFGLFEATETIRQALAINLNHLLNSFGLRKKIITFIKDEGGFLNAMISTLRYVVHYDILGFGGKFQWKLLWTCFF
jgi:hypothetical protein